MSIKKYCAAVLAELFDYHYRNPSNKSDKRIPNAFAISKQVLILGIVPPRSIRSIVAIPTPEASANSR